MLCLDLPCVRRIAEEVVQILVPLPLPAEHIEASIRRVPQHRVTSARPDW